MKHEVGSRQIHLDFHTSALIENIGASFDPDVFAETLYKARVNSISLFARCHHGMLYYDSKKFPELVHPHLKNKNLLKQQIDACHKRGIRTPIYTTVKWDEYIMKKHPEWRCVDIEGNPVNQKLFEPGFNGFLCLNTAYRQFLFEQTEDILECIPEADGIFFDILHTKACACSYCRSGMEKMGLNPLEPQDLQQYAEHTSSLFQVEMTERIKAKFSQFTIFYNRGHVGPALLPSLGAFTHLELESLPGGAWGYMHFPITMRYARTLGLECVGQTGKFHTSWGDFHSFKNKEALEFEVFHMLALTAKCLVGDQLEPSGVLSVPVYEMIGSVYEKVERKEPWCLGAVAKVEIGVFTPEEYYPVTAGKLSTASMGVNRMLQEGAYQFDFIDSHNDLSKYKVLIMPDKIPVSMTFAKKLQSFVDQGGAVIATFESGLNEDQTGYNWSTLGVKLQPEQTRDIHGSLVRGRVFRGHAYADYLLPNGAIGKGLPETEHVMYMKGVEVDALPGSEVLSEAIRPIFNRTYEHFSSHKQAPSSGQRGYDGIVKNGKVIYFAHPIFDQYQMAAPRWCKQLVFNALALLLPEPIVRHEGPSTVIAAMNEQKEEQREVLHVLHYIPERRGSEIDVLEDVIPLYDLKLSVKTDQEVQSVRCVPEMEDLPFHHMQERIEFTLPKLHGHQMIEITLGRIPNQ